MVTAINKIKFIFLPIFLLVSSCIEVDAQLKYHEDPVQTTLTETSDFNTFIENKRRGFTKRRYGRHTFYVEAGLFGGYYTGKRYSLNYDLLAQSGESNALSIRLGYGQNESSNDSTYHGDEKFIPIGINVLLGSRNLFELGLGGYYYTERGIITPYVSIGFRHQNPKGGFMYRVAFDMHLERVYDAKGVELQKTAVFGPIVGLGWTF